MILQVDKTALNIYLDDFIGVVLIIVGKYIHIMGSHVLMSNHIYVVFVLFLNCVNILYVYFYS